MNGTLVSRLNSGVPERHDSIDERGTREKAAMCVFEYIYFSRPDSYINGDMLYNFRKRCGRRLFAESHIECDIVSSVPESATPAALGYAEASKIPFEQVLNKNRYVGRSFIKPSTVSRTDTVLRKFGPLTEVVKGIHRI